MDIRNSKSNTSGGSSRALDADSLTFFNEAIYIADRLIKSAIWSSKRCTWTGDDIDLVENEWKVIHRTLDPFIYSGTAGVAHFLARCFSITNKHAYRESAMGAIRQSIYLMENDATDQSLRGYYDGGVGVALTMIDIGQILNEPDLISAGDDMLKHTRASIMKDVDALPSDMVSGIAGIILGYLYCSSNDTRIQLKADALKLAQHLIQRAHTDRIGWYWKADVESDTDKGLCGLGHGNAGIASALFACFEHSGETNLREAAQQALLFESGWFNPTFGNWPDMRDELSEATKARLAEPAYSVFWCHGAAGIGLSRLQAFRATGDRSILFDVNAAISACYQEVTREFRYHRESGVVSPNLNLSVCHGLGSIIDFLTAAHHVLGTSELFDRARKIGQFGIHIGDPNGHPPHEKNFLCGIPNGGETPGLMTGLAGIGMNYLNLSGHHFQSASGMVPFNIASD